MPFLNRLSLLSVPCFITSSLVAGDDPCCFQINRYAAEGGAGHIAVADLNGDSLPDLAVTTFDSVAVLVNFGPGQFAQIDSNPPFLNGPTSIATGKLDGDSHVDIVVSDINTLWVVPNDGSGGPLEPDSYSLPNGAVNLAVADMDQDGHNDVVVLGRSFINLGMEVTILRNDGSGRFNIVSSVSVSELLVSVVPLNMAVGDVNNDGFPDVAIPEPFAGVWILPNNGGALEEATLFVDAGGAPYVTVALGDLTGNEMADIVLGSALSNQVGLFVNDGTGTFSSSGVCEIGMSPPMSVDIGDVDGDGANDIVAAGWNPLFGTLSVLRNRGGGVFSRTGADYSCILPDHLGRLVVEDIDLDGRDDAIATAAPGVTVFRSQCGPPACPADVDGDGVAGFADILEVLANWGCRPSEGDCDDPRADVNGDDLVGFDDILAILSVWGPCP